MLPRITYGARRIMSNPAQVMEGVFAVNKPQSVSSAGVLRELQDFFNPSKIFASWMHKERQRLESEWSNQKGNRSGRQRRKLNQLQVKLGHGGTLDPLATGVLIVGVGSGTKTLNSFLACTKTYETVVVFGAATDSYDVVGKLVARAPTAHITQEIVETSLHKFRGKIMQKPPIFSALKVKGKPLYEYARSGEEIPIEIEERPVEVLELELIEWLDSGSHDFKEPVEEAEENVKATAQKLLDLPPNEARSSLSVAPANGSTTELKRKREGSVDELITPSSPQPKRHKEDGEEEPTMSGALPPQSKATGVDTDKKAGTPTSNGKNTPKDLANLSGLPVASGPAVRLRLTVSSGFYVRSLAHDLGAAVGSLGYMAKLVRSRQGDFELGKNVLSMDELREDEESWGPKLQSLLQDWSQQHTANPD